MEGRKSKLSQVIFTELFFNDVVDLVLSREITITLAFGFKAKSFLDKTFHKFNSFQSPFAGSQKRHGL